MRALRSVLALVLALTLSACSSDVQVGVEAYERGDYAAALEELRPLAERGDARAQYFLGSMYAEGEGVPEDYAEAAKWYHLAAERGDAEAQFSLGGLYFYGAGVPRDLAEAVKWYRRAAERGDFEAQIRLGNMYENGVGLPQDYVLSHMWFNLAATHLPAGPNSMLGALNRDFIEKSMTPVQVAEAQRLAREWKPK